MAATGKLTEQPSSVLPRHVIETKVDMVYLRHISESTAKCWPDKPRHRHRQNRARKQAGKSEVLAPPECHNPLFGQGLEIPWLDWLQNKLDNQGQLIDVASIIRDGTVNKVNLRTRPRVTFETRPCPYDSRLPRVEKFAAERDAQGWVGPCPYFSWLGPEALVNN